MLGSKKTWKLVLETKRPTTTRRPPTKNNRLVNTKPVGTPKKCLPNWPRSYEVIGKLSPVRLLHPHLKTHPDSGVQVGKLK
uniref:Uncharacterized protein n=1 Tax=Anguilla anguilla TaxID=7936 RepID=A0A0E9UZN7_ANGAN